MQLTKAQLSAIDTFVFTELEGKYSGEQYEASYQQWAKGGRGWSPIQQGGTGQMRLLMWYHHTYKPGSQEWRPVLIIQAALQYLRLPFLSGYTRPPAALETPAELERDNREIQDGLTIPYRPLSGKIATRLQQLTVIVSAGLLLVACEKAPISQTATNNAGIQVDLLFEQDGCKVYRFEDAGRNIYYSDCSGKTSYSYKSGKTTHYMESINAGSK